MKLLNLARLFLLCNVNNGISTLFWHDNWTDLVIYYRFPEPMDLGWLEVVLPLWFQTRCLVEDAHYLGGDHQYWCCFESACLLNHQTLIHCRMTCLFGGTHLLSLLRIFPHPTLESPYKFIFNVSGIVFIQHSKNIPSLSG